jgi:hydrogenase maturation protease
MRTTVIGVGNTLMGDDGFGVRVAEELETRYPDADASGVRIVSGHTAGMALMQYVLAADRVIFVDAATLDDEPGSVYRFDPDAAGLTGLRSNTSHGVGIPHLIGVSRMQGHCPEFIVYAVRVGDIMCGPDTLSEPVAAAISDVIDMVARDAGLLETE